MMKPTRCEFCKFLSGNDLTCRRKAPSQTKMNSREEFRVVWPTVALMDWCGEYQAWPEPPDYSEAAGKEKP